MPHKILFLADNYPAAKHAGGVLYSRIMEVYGVENFCYFAVGYRYHEPWPYKFKDIPHKYFSLRLGSRIKWFRYFRKIPFVEELYYFSRRPILKHKLKLFIKQNNVETVFAILRKDVLSVVNTIQKNNIRVLGFVSDTVEAEYSDKSVLYEFKYREYYKAILNSNSLYVAGEAMEQYLHGKFQKQTSILRLGFEKHEENKTAAGDLDKKINVFFGGSMYATSEMELFLTALNKFAKHNQNITVCFNSASKHKIRNVRKYNNIFVKEFGWLDEKKLPEIMKTCHFGYIPYMFDKKRRHQMSLAFPNKVGLYVSAGLPVFFHGPIYSSVVPFFDKYNCGVHCHSLDPEVIFDLIQKMVSTKNNYLHMREQAELSFKNEFSLHVLKQNFEKLIDS